MVDTTDNVTRAEAREALDSVAKMESSAWRRGVPARWFGAVMAALIGSMFAIYALEDPNSYIVLPILAMAIVMKAARDKSGAYGREFPNTKANRWQLALFTVELLLLFFGSIVIRRTYDAAWVPIAAGLLVALIVFMASERERRAYLARADHSQVK